MLRGFPLLICFILALATACDRADQKTRAIQNIAANQPEAVEVSDTAGYSASKTEEEQPPELTRPSNSNTVSASKDSSVATKIGDIIEFGNLDWQVLEVKENQMLLLLHAFLHRTAYNDQYVDITWENCDLRYYLNGEFYNSFTKEDQERIVETRVTNANNPVYGTNGGNETLDMVFLLSIGEALKYFGDSGRLAAMALSPPEPGWGINDEYSPARIVPNKEDSPVGWWLRSPGYINRFAANINGKGGLLPSGINVHAATGVRPAVWVRL